MAEEAEGAEDKSDDDEDEDDDDDDKEAANRSACAPMTGPIRRAKTLAQARREESKCWQRAMECDNRVDKEGRRGKGEEDDSVETEERDESEED